MHFSNRLLVLAISIPILLVLAGCSFSLAGDITPPPNYTPPAVFQNPASGGGQPVAASTAFPLLPPDPANGAAIFAVKCAPCHGDKGLGDGPQAGNLPTLPAAIGTAELARNSRPSDWFAIVSEGNLSNFMPGFKESLDDRSRWDVVAYVYSLSQTPAGLAEGKQLYEAQCSSCHGPEGKGGDSAPDWSKQDRLAKLSAVEQAAVIASGQGTMPAFPALTEDQRFNLVDYIRNLTYNNGNGQQALAQTPTSIPPQTQSAGSPSVSETPLPAGTESAANTPSASGASGTPAAGTPAVQYSGSLTIHGKITNSTPGAVVNGLTVTLTSFEGMNQVAQTTTTSNPDGTYEFKIDHKAGMSYMVQVDYKNYTFNSDILHSTDITSASAELPLTIYATTTDTKNLSIDRLHVFFDFSNPGVVQVVELFIVSNSGQDVVVAAGPDKPILKFRLPTGSSNLQFDGGAIGDRFINIDGGFGDLAAIAPGQSQHQVLFSYDMPYDRKLALKIPVPMAVNAVVVMMPQDGVRLQSDQLTVSGSRDVQGLTYELFTASNLPADGELSLSLAGNASASPASISSSNGLLIGLGAFGLVLIGAGIWLYRSGYGLKRKKNGLDVPAQPAVTPTQESLLDEILALDDLYQAGKLPEKAYQQRRAELKEQLKALNF
jgi:mono/diheme cytochrome c family protein